MLFSLTLIITGTNFKMQIPLRVMEPQLGVKKLELSGLWSEEAAALRGAWGVVTWCELTGGTMGNRAKSPIMQTAEGPSKLPDQPGGCIFSLSHILNTWLLLLYGHIWDAALSCELRAINTELNPKKWILFKKKRHKFCSLISLSSNRMYFLCVPSNM